MKIAYQEYFEYEGDKCPNICFGYGNREAYTLTYEGIVALSKLLNMDICDLCSESTTLNIFSNGRINIMLMDYNSKEEEYQEKEILTLTKEEFENLNLVYENPRWK